jgi:hypothetical protein
MAEKVAAVAAALLLALFTQFGDLGRDDPGVKRRQEGGVMRGQLRGGRRGGALW